MKNVELLAVAIVGQACEDYEKAYQKGDQKEMNEIADWFKGDGFESLNLQADGENIVELMNDRLRRHGKLRIK